MSRGTELAVVESSELPQFAADLVARLIREAASSKSAPVSLALAGGTTPRLMHERLALAPDVPWSRVAIYFGDERAVPPEHADSNYRMARESLLDRVPLDPAAVHRMHAEASDRERAASDYEALLPPGLDILVLGIGEDGHTLSLFPGAAAVAEQRRRVLPVVGPKPPPQRLTLTAPVIAAARHVVMLANGAGKADAVARALEGEWEPSLTPAQLAREGHWLVDRAAASALRAK